MLKDPDAMSIKIKSSTAARVTQKQFQISQWTAKPPASQLYRMLDGTERPELMRADTIAFNPGEMLSGTGRPHAAFDASYKNLDMARLKPIYMSVGLFIGFLLALRYLRS